jgi:hypothetical protein
MAGCDGCGKDGTLYAEWYCEDCHGREFLRARIAELERQLKMETNAKEYFMGYVAGLEVQILELKNTVTRLQADNTAEVLRRREVAQLLRERHVPNCSGYPTRTHMDSLEDDPEHGCDCISCRVGRFLAKS